MRQASLIDVERRFKLGAEPAENLRLYGIQPETAPPFTMEHAKRWVQSLIDHPYAWVIEGPTLLGSVRLD
jgi:hypothetical protein